MLSGSCLEGNISMCVGRHRVWFDGCCYIRHWVNTVSLSADID